MRLIDADELYDEIEYDALFRVQTAKDIVELIFSAPTVDAVPVRHGKNENQKYHEVDEFRCSECGLHLEGWTRYVYDEDSDEEYAQEYVFKHCPECGAKMDGDVDE